MDLRELQTFVAVAEEAGFTRAAARLHVVQSAVSATVARLEREVGHPLFRRTPRGVEPTAEGAFLLEPAREVLAAADAFGEAVDGLSGVLRGRLAVGILSAPDLLHLASLFTAFAREYPEVTFTVRSDSGGTVGLLDAIVAETLDLSLVVLPLDAPPAIELTPLLSGVQVLAVAVGHELAGRSDLRAEEAATYPFVDFPLGYSSRLAVDTEFDRHGLRRGTRIEAPATDLAAGYVAAGIAVGFLPEFVVRGRKDLVEVPVADLRPIWGAALAVKRGRRHGRAVDVMRGLLLDRAAEVAQALAAP